MLLDEGAPGQAQQGLGVGEHSDDVGARLISLLARSRGLVNQVWRQWW